MILFPFGLLDNLHDLTTSTDIITNDNQIKGPGLWKMNCALLKDDRYVDDIK